MMAANASPAYRPSHPGALLRMDVLPALRISVSDMARAMGISRQTLHALLAERASVTPAMALRLGKVSGNGPEFWLRMQQARDLWDAERELADVVERIPTLKEP